MPENINQDNQSNQDNIDDIISNILSKEYDPDNIHSIIASLENDLSNDSSLSPVSVPLNVKIIQILKKLRENPAFKETILPDEQKLMVRAIRHSKGLSIEYKSTSAIKKFEDHKLKNTLASSFDTPLDMGALDKMKNDILNKKGKGKIQGTGLSSVSTFREKEIEKEVKPEIKIPVVSHPWDDVVAKPSVSKFSLFSKK